MQILAINQFFWPDTAATGQLLTDVSRDIDPNLHTFTVFCGSAGYGEVDTMDPPSARIIRSSGIPFSRGHIGRLASYCSFFMNAILRSLLCPKPDVVLTLTTPPLISLAGTLLKILRGSRHFIWEMDLYPEIAVDLNMLKPKSPITRVIGALADVSRKRADGIIALDDDMKRRLIVRGIPEGKIFVAENWADGCEIRPAPFEEGPLVVQYSGTFGRAHEESTILEVIRHFRQDGRFRFLFVGGGARRQRLEELCRSEGIDNVEFRSYVVRSALGSSLARGHLGLVTQIPATVGAVVPSKIYGIMASGRPLLYIGPSGTTTARMIEHHKCGWQIEPGNAVSMVELLEYLEQNRDLVRTAGLQARRLFEKHYDKPVGTVRILSILGVEPPR